MYIYLYHIYNIIYIIHIYISYIYTVSYILYICRYNYELSADVQKCSEAPELRGFAQALLIFFTAPRLGLFRRDGQCSPSLEQCWRA